MKPYEESPFETGPVEAPDLSGMDNDTLCAMLILCGRSDDPTDKAFAKACRDQLAKRKPEMRTANS